MVAAPKPNRCTGHCCRRFWLPHSPKELRDPKRYFQEIEALLDMLIPIGPSRVGGHLYNCRNLGKDGDCENYDKRPTMCQVYPMGRPCLREGCTLPDRGYGPESHHVFSWHWRESWLLGEAAANFTW